MLQSLCLHYQYPKAILLSFLRFHEIQNLCFVGIKDLSDFIKLYQLCFDDNRLNRDRDRSNHIVLRMKKFCIHSCEVTDEDIVRTLESVRHICKSTRRIFFSHYCELKDTAIVAFAKYCYNVQGISLKSNKGITDKSVLAIAEHCHNIQHISLRDCINITDTSVVALAKQCLHIEDIDLAHIKNITDDAILTLANHCKHIKKINLGFCTKITDVGVKILVEQCPNIETLSLTACEHITDVVVLAISKHCLNIQVIDFSCCCHITDVAVCTLAKNCHNIQRISLIACKITHVSLDALAMLSHLRRIDIVRCYKITEKDLQSFLLKAKGKIVDYYPLHA